MSWYSQSSAPPPPTHHPTMPHSQKPPPPQQQQQVPFQPHSQGDYNQQQWPNTGQYPPPQQQQQQLDNGTAGWNNNQNHHHQQQQINYYNNNPPVPQQQPQFQAPAMTSQHFQGDPGAADGWGDWGDEWTNEGNNNNVNNNNSTHPPPPVQTNFYNQQQPYPSRPVQMFNNQTYDSNMNYQMPQQPAPSLEANQNVIADSFSTNTANDNWNWNSMENNSNISLPFANKQPVFDKVSKEAVEKINSQSSNQINQPDDAKNTQQLQQQYQWPNSGPAAPINQPSFDSNQFSSQPVATVQEGSDLDNLDQALVAMNVMKIDNSMNQEVNQPPVKEVKQERPPSIGPPPPVMEIKQDRPVSVGPRHNPTPPVVELKQERPPSVIPQPPEPVNQENLGQVSIPQSVEPKPQMPPPQVQNTAPPALPPMMGPGQATSNPFKRTGGIGHRGYQTNPVSAINQPSPMPSLPPVQPQVPDLNQPILTEIENRESVTPNNNDRNQYLQTSPLSEETDTMSLNQNQQQTDLVDNLPPPGLSRFVLGEPEIGSGNPISVEPPVPQFDRMVPGTDLENASNINMEREADGQASIVSNIVPVNRTYPPQPEVQEENLTDRNLYQVPGESTHNEIPPQPVISQSRVVTGNENIRTFAPVVPIPIPQPEIMEQQRDLEMEGENLEDVQPQQRSNLTREEPIEGANTGDDDPIISSGGAAISNSANQEIETVPPPSEVMPRKENIPRKETSTGEDSEKDRNAYYNKKSSSRGNRNEDNTGSLRRKPKPKDRYDSEESDYYSERERDKRRYREGSYRGEDREKDRDGRRYRDHDRSDRYDRRGGERDRYRDDDDSRYGRDDRRDRKRYNRDEDRDDYRNRRRDNDAYDSKREDKDRSHRRGDRNNRDNRDHDRNRGNDDRRSDRNYRGGERRHREKERRDYEEDRSGSRNTERSRDPRMYYPQNYYDYGAYSQQQYLQYETLRRTNPQAYAEWYRKYYAQMAQAQMVAASEGPANDRESVHSGRSSANDKDRYNRSLHHTYSWGGGGSGAGPESLTMLDGSYMNQSYSFTQPSQTPSAMHLHHTQQHSYYSHSELSSRFDKSRLDNDQRSVSNRMTPFKFTNEHSQVSMTNGLLVYIRPKYSQNGVTNLVKIINVGAAANDNDPEKRLFTIYPGPLIKGSTHKKTVIEFCEERIRLGPTTIIAPGRENSLLRSHGNSLTSLNSITNANSLSQTTSYKASHNLLWNLLILLLRQNGMVVGTDIAELLLKNTSDFPHASGSNLTSRRDSIQSSNKQVQSRKDREGDATLSDIDSDESGAEGAENRDETPSLSKEKDKKMSEEEITEKFRNYLLYGNMAEALDWATDNNLWGHALFLASKVDRRSHANVMMKFANKLSLNDPLQTLYQLMSLRMPSSVTSVVDKKWGDWRPHLAMIISNTSQKPELDRKAITTLGDSLFQIGDVYGSHFCYLMAQVGFGKYETAMEANGNPSSKLILLGSSPNRSFKEFASTEAIMMTEIYEYACTLSDEKYSIAEFQSYKFILATRLLDYGYQLKTFLYMEQLAKHIQQDPSKYESTLISNVCNFADRLRYYDPMQEKSMDDQSESRESDGENQKWIQDLRNCINVNQDQLMNLTYSQGLTNQPQANIDQQFAELNQQFTELNLQYQNFGPQPPQLPQSHQPSPEAQQFNQNYQQQLPQQGTENDNQQYGSPYQYQQQQDSYQDQNQQQIPEQGGHFYNPNSYDSGSYSQPHSLAAGDNNQAVPNSQMGYDYFAQQQQQQQGSTPEEEVAPKPQITMPSSFSQKPGFYDDEPGSNQTIGRRDSGQNEPQSKGQKGASKDKENKAQPKDQSSGWFGGIWGKLSLKPKNQMILPDDKNPTIVWDPDKKKWVNTDGDVAEEEAFKPPPKMSDMGMQPQSMPQQQQQPPQMQAASPPSAPQSYQPSPMSFQSAAPIPQMNAPAPIVPDNNNSPQQPDTVDNADPSKAGPNNLRSNQFKLQRNRTLKKSYVDVFNPSGAPMKPIENVMAPSLPAVPQTGFFVPGASDNYQQNEGSTPFYNPNQYAQ